jgi:hypothetical protein
MGGIQKLIKTAFKNLKTIHQKYAAIQKDIISVSLSLRLCGENKFQK